jgi:hypothetical protein
MSLSFFTNEFFAVIIAEQFYISSTQVMNVTQDICCIIATLFDGSLASGVLT